MIVKFNHDISLKKIDNWPVSKKNRYNIVKCDTREGDLFVVYGILMLPDNVFYLLNISGKDRDIPIINLFSSDFFVVVDSSVSRYWKVCVGISHKNIAYDNTSFALFNYVGVDRLVTDGDFYENYLDGRAQEVHFIKHIKMLLDDEVASVK